MSNCSRHLFRKIFARKTDLDFPSSYIPNRFIMERVKNGPILVIGDYTGRDFLTLKKRFPNTYLLDIVDNKITEEHFVQQSITEPTSFPAGTFQYVVIAEVIEHLWEDVAALQEVHRLLAPGGRLLLTVPFYHDSPEYHFRIHSPKTIRRLLEYCGFEVLEMAYRGVAIRSNLLVAGLALILFPFMGNRALAAVNGWIYGLHCLLAKYERINRFSWAFGGLIFARKHHRRVDPLLIQREDFQKIPEVRT